MKLELCTFPVTRAQWGKRSELTSGLLSINKEELGALLKADSRLKEVKPDLALPGEKTRIIHALDVIEPRVKVSGPGTIFPGFLGPPVTVGQGRTHRLAGAAVVLSADLPFEEVGVYLPREQIIDLAGPGAALSPFSRTINLVLTFEPASGIPVVEYDAAIRQAGLKCASYLARLSCELKPDRLETFELRRVDSALPKVAYVCQVYSCGPLYNCCLYGQEIGGSLPSLLHPNELMDGALVGGKASMAVETYIHCNNSVVSALYRRHGQEVNFIGVVITTGGLSNRTDFLKERSAHYVAKLLKMLGAEGAVLTQEGGGNSIMDQMLICRACEQEGIKTALVSFEMGGAAGTDIPLIYTVPEADAMVSVGNREERVLLLAIDRVIGGETVFAGAHRAQDSFETMTNYIKSAVNQAGFGTLKAWDF